MLHDPDYREEYAIDLKQEFPRLPLYRDFKAWTAMGQELLDLHIGFESAAPFPLERVDTGKQAKRVLLRADTSGGRIVLDDVTTLRGVPERAWRYRLGSRSALEWVLDQHKERTPRDPTIRERFNTYRFADHKERVDRLAAAGVCGERADDGDRGRDGGGGCGARARGVDGGGAVTSGPCGRRARWLRLACARLRR